MFVRILPDVVRVRRIEFNTHAWQRRQHNVPGLGSHNAIDPVAVVEAQLYAFLSGVIDHRLVHFDDVFKLGLEVITISLAAAGHYDGAVDVCRKVDGSLESADGSVALRGILTDKGQTPTADGGRMHQVLPQP